MDMGILSSIFSALLCPECSSDNLELIEMNSQKKGTASALTLNCGYEKQFHTLLYTMVKHLTLTVELCIVCDPVVLVIMVKNYSLIL